MSGKTIVAFVLALLLLAGTAAARDDEYRQLEDEQKSLSRKIEELKAEQDFLLFQKVLSTSDSKYMILNISNRKGQLRYKNRVLRDFSFVSIKKPVLPVKQGVVSLTKKIAGPRQKYALVFGKTIILQAKGAAAYREEGILRAALPKKDFLALYYALEDGAQTYILP